MKNEQAIEQESVTTELQVRSDFETIRNSIAARCTTDHSDNSWTAVKLQSGEMLLSALRTDTQGIVVFHRKYGKKPGYRTVVLAMQDDERFHMVTEAFASTLAPTSRPARIVVTKAVTVEQESVMLPSDGVSDQMTYTYHVRSYGDKHVICSTDSLADAQRIVTCLGNCGIWQFRNSAAYDDSTPWIVV